MISSLSDTVTLCNGVKMPGVGFGTYKSTEGNDAEESVREAIRLGMRHIDCASFYKNEEGVGRGLAAALSGEVMNGRPISQSGEVMSGSSQAIQSVLNRSDLFITSKVWTSDKAYDDVIRSCKNSLKDLGLEYLDLLLMHWPADDHAYPDWREINFDTWRAFISLYKDGLVRAIGVSNYWPEHIEPLMDQEVPPMVDQIEYHPGYMQNGTTPVLAGYRENYYKERAGIPYDPNDRIRTEYTLEECTAVAAVPESTVAAVPESTGGAATDTHSGFCTDGSGKVYSGFCEDNVPAYCKARGIVVEAWSPLGRAKVLNDPLLVSLAGKYGKTTSQICLRWELQHGIVPLPKSVHPERIKENTEIFDFDLSAEDMSLIDVMPITGFSTHTPKDVPW